MLEKLRNLTDRQKRELGKLTAGGEGIVYLKSIGIELTPEEAAEIAARLPDDALEGIAGGGQSPPGDKSHKLQF